MSNINKSDEIKNELTTIIKNTLKYEFDKMNVFLLARLNKIELRLDNLESKTNEIKNNDMNDSISCSISQT